MRSEQPEGGLRDQVILVTKDWSKVAGFATCGSLFGWSLDWSWVGATAPARKIEDHVGGSKEAPFREILYVCATAWQVLKAMAWKHTVSARMAHLMFRLTEHLPATSANMNWRKSLRTSTGCRTPLLLIACTRLNATLPAHRVR
jgi:hypothetical protein